MSTPVSFGNVPTCSSQEKFWDVQLENSIRTAAGTQEGAIRLLDDLKAKPFSIEIHYILKKLLNNDYSKSYTRHKHPNHLIFLSFELQRAGFKDLAEKVKDGYYEHDGWNRGVLNSM